MNPFSIVGSLRDKYYEIEHLLRELNVTRDMVVADNTRQLQRTHPNPLNAHGKKCFSQTDEDGITIEVLRRLNVLSGGTYAEFGVGNGMENNSLVLAALGWRGFWVGGQDLLPDIAGGRGCNFHYEECWITQENILEITGACLRRIECSQVDVISLDLDGNDIHFIRSLLGSGLRPKLFIAEYNAKFCPPIRFEIPYDAQHVWANDDYFGASLASLDAFFVQFKYTLVCCNTHSGSNAFFVDDVYESHFADVPKSIHDKYVGPRYTLYGQHGHKPSVRTIETLFNAFAP